MWSILPLQGTEKPMPGLLIQLYSEIPWRPVSQNTQLVILRERKPEFVKKLKKSLKKPKILNCEWKLWLICILRLNSIHDRFDCETTVRFGHRPNLPHYYVRWFSLIIFEHIYNWFWRILWRAQRIKSMKFSFHYWDVIQRWGNF